MHDNDDPLDTDCHSQKVGLLAAVKLYYSKSTDLSH